MGSDSPDQYGPLEYSEQINSGNITSTPGNSSITRTFFIDHQVIPLFLDDLLGYASVGNAGAVERVLPDQHPLFSNYYAMEASVEGLGLGSNLQYNTKLARSLVAKVTAIYKSIDFEVVADNGSTQEFYRFVTRSMVPAGEYFSVDSTGMYFCSNIGSDGRNKGLSVPPQKLTGTTEVTFVWRLVPPNPASSRFVPPNLTAITNCLGKVHSSGTNFDSQHYNFPSGTVLFLGCEPRMVMPRVTTGAVENNLFWEIGLKFLYRNNGFINRGTPSGTINEFAGHQFTWDQGNRRWDLITSNGQITGNRLYETADLNSLLTIG